MGQLFVEKDGRVYYVAGKGPPLHVPEQVRAVVVGMMRILLLALAAAQLRWRMLGY